MKTLISVHVAKAGGSSTRRVLEKAYGASFMADYADNPSNPESQRVLDPIGYMNRRASVPDGVYCVHGHFHPGKYIIGKETILATILRHPVDNIISIFSFWRANVDRYDALHKYFLRSHLTVIQMAQLPLLKNLYSETYFGGFNMSRFDIIGRHEKRDEALHELALITNTTLDTSIYDNKTPPDKEREDIANNVDIRRQLTDILAEDINFYERYAR